MTTGRALAMRQGRVVIGTQLALHDVDFALDAGEFAVLLGPNGSGKTTLVRALLGLVGLSRGHVEIFGQPQRSFRSWERIGYVPQRATAATGVPATVEEVALLGRVARTRLLGGYTEQDLVAVADALAAAELTHLAHKPVGELSGGEQQRVLIARALVTHPDVLLLDEPISGVDVEHQESFAATLAALHERGCAVLVVAHSVGVLEPLVSRAVVLQSGRVTYDGPPQAEHLGVVSEHHHPRLETGPASFGRVTGHP